MNLIVVDNFLPMVNLARSWALAQQYYTAEQLSHRYGKHTDWPGVRSDNVVDLDSDYADLVLGKVANIIASNTGKRDLSIKSYFQITTINDGSSWVHQDNNVDYAAVLYLSPHAPVDAGTTLYKCNNVDKWNSFMTDQAGYQKLKTINETDDVELYTELFTPVDVVGNVYNRLVIYPGEMYHKSSKYFGTDNVTGRLTQVCFINNGRPV